MSDSLPETVRIPVPGLWARVFQGSADSLAQVAARHWYPVYAWLRVAGNPSVDAAAMTQSFFSALQTSESPEQDDPTTVRLREFLLMRLSNFAANGFPAFATQRPISMDVPWAERVLAEEPARSEDEVFCRRWALMILQATLDAIQGEYMGAGKPTLFGTLKPFLSFSPPDESGYANAAREADLSVSAFHLNVFQFRKRYREVLRACVADTVRSLEDVDSELTALLVSAS